MESRGERIERIKRETDKEVRGVVESSASLIPEVNPEMGELEEEEEDLTVRIYEAVAVRYKELYDSFKLGEFFETSNGKKVLEIFKKDMNSSLIEGKIDASNASWATQSLFSVLFMPEIKKLFTEEEIADWITQVKKDDRFAQKLNEDVFSNLSRSVTDSTCAVVAIWTISSIILAPEIRGLFTEEEIKEWMIQIENNGFTQKFKEGIKTMLSRGMANSNYVYDVVQTLSCIVSTPWVKKYFKDEEISEWLIQAGNENFVQNLKKQMELNFSAGMEHPKNATEAIWTLSAILILFQSLPAEANRLRAEEYDKGKGKKVKPVSSPRLPERKL